MLLITRSCFPIIVLVLFILSVEEGTAQKRSVLIEPLKRKINQDAPLPAQVYFNFQIPVSNSTGIVEVDISKGKTMGGSPERVSWVRPVDYNGDFAELPVDVKLKSNANYSFNVSTYIFLSDSEKVNLRAYLLQYISNYLDAIVEADDKKITLSQKTDQVIKDLNAIVVKGLNGFKSFRNQSFDGFSGIVKLKIQQISSARLGNAAYNVKPAKIDTATSDLSVKASFTRQLKDELKEIISTELNNYLDTDFLKLYDHFVVANQYTEKTQTVLPLFVGYGAVYFGGGVHDLDYDTKPYAGFSIPLGRGDGKYFSRTTFIMGVFLQNFKDGKDSTITGPLVDRPVFAGLGFRIYDFINFNAGMVATSTIKQNLADIKTENIKLRPFIGLNFQFNLWVGVNKK